MHLRPALAIVLSLEFFLGGLPRLIPSLIPRVGERIDRKYPGSVHALWPVIPIRDPTWHRRFVGSLMSLTGVLLALTDTRGSAMTFSLVGFLTGCGIVRCGGSLFPRTTKLTCSQYRMGMPFWLPCVNMVLGGYVWWTGGR